MKNDVVVHQNKLKEKICNSKLIYKLKKRQNNITNLKTNNPKNILVYMSNNISNESKEFIKELINNKYYIIISKNNSILNLSNKSHIKISSIEKFINKYKEKAEFKVLYIDDNQNINCDKLNIYRQNGFLIHYNISNTKEIITHIDIINYADIITTTSILIKKIVKKYRKDVLLLDTNIIDTYEKNTLRSLYDN